MNHTEVIWELDLPSLMEAPKKHVLIIKDRIGRNITLQEENIQPALDQGLIKKTDDGYVFVGNRETLRKFKQHKTSH